MKIEKLYKVEQDDAFDGDSTTSYLDYANIQVWDGMSKDEEEDLADYVNRNIGSRHNPYHVKNVWGDKASLERESSYGGKEYCMVSEVYVLTFDGKHFLLNELE